MPKLVPHMHMNREYESPLHEFRVSAELFCKKLAEKTGVSVATIGQLANGMVSPIHGKTWQLTESAKKLCDFFNVGPEELFPRYYCKINQAPPEKVKVDVLPYDTWSEKVASGDFVLKYIYARSILNMGMEHLSAREKRVIKGMFFENETLQDIAIEFHVSCARILQIKEKAIKKLKYWMRKEEINA
ncbi:MAG: hypothetical protein FWF99_00145 [Desulfovibrionaceae bacterium]|nr:hypothetical protein [Desulfovibrionaceae bacterium]